MNASASAGGSSVTEGSRKRQRESVKANDDNLVDLNVSVVFLCAFFYLEGYSIRVGPISFFSFRMTKITCGIV